MEFLLYLWDEIDDCSAACRHLASAAAREAAGAMALLALAASTGAATFSGACRRLVQRIA